MDNFWDLLEQHGDLLNVKGYCEEALNSPDKPGWYLRQLELHLSKAIKDAHSFNEKSEFDLKTVAFFNDDADLILFNFNYEYDPNTMDLRITRLDATMDGKEMNIPLMTNKDLPQSTMVHRSFTAGEKLKTARHIANHHSTDKANKI